MNNGFVQIEDDGKKESLRCKESIFFIINIIIFAAVVSFPNHLQFILETFRFVFFLFETK